MGEVRPSTSPLKAELGGHTQEEGGGGGGVLLFQVTPFPRNGRHGLLPHSKRKETMSAVS